MGLTKVQAAGLTADLIDETKLADNSIDSEHYNDGSIDNEHLADDAVGIAELSATGTASSSTFLRGDNSWQTVSTTPEGTAVLSTGETGTAKFLRVDGDNSCSWQVPPDTNTTYSVGDGGLTTNDFTNTLKTKLDGIAASANAYVHPNHSGEVTSTADGATVIADDIVDEANLKISNAGSNGQFLSKQSGNTGGLTWAAASPDWQSFQGEMVGDQTIANGTWTRVKFNAQNWDTNSNFDHTTDDWYYAAPAAGKYWYKVSLMLDGTGTNTELDVGLYKSAGGTGTYTIQKKTHRWITTPNGGSFGVQTSGLIELAASDRLAAYTWHNGGSDKDLDDNFCLFEMFKLDGA